MFGAKNVALHFIFIIIVSLQGGGLCIYIRVMPIPLFFTPNEGEFANSTLFLCFALLFWLKRM